jgi:hypothetical protein
MRKDVSRELTRRQIAELRALKELSDDAIDTSDAPELSDWSGAERDLFYQPVRQRRVRRSRCRPDGR